MQNYYDVIDRTKSKSDFQERLYNCYSMIDQVYADQAMDGEMLKRKSRLQQKAAPKNFLSQWISRFLGREAEDIFEQYCEIYEMEKINEAVARSILMIKEQRERQGETGSVPERE